MSSLLRTKQAQHDAPRTDDATGPDNRLDRVIEAMRRDIKNLQAENASLKSEIETLKRGVKI